MKIVLISHSNVALRQQLFAEELSKHADILCVAPERWGAHRTSQKSMSVAGFSYELFPSEIMGNGSIYTYLWSSEALLKIQNFRPDIIYCMAEWNSLAARELYGLSREIGCKFVLFTWENIRKPNPDEAVFLKKCNVVVCGNSDAQNICMEAGARTFRLVQVGIDSGHFRDVSDGSRPYDIVFIGRNVPEKGIAYVKKLAEDGLKVLICHDVPYLKIPAKLSSAKVCVVPSIDMPMWREQFPSAIAESLMVGTPVVAFDSGNMKEHYGDCMNVYFSPQENYTILKQLINGCINSGDLREKLGLAARQWAVENFDNKVIAEKLMEAFNGI